MFSRIFSYFFKRREPEELTKEPEEPEEPTKEPEEPEEPTKEPEEPTKEPEELTKKLENSLLELFNKSHRGMSYEELEQLLNDSYLESAIYTLKIIAHIRNVKNGRGERDLSRKAYRWLEKHHEKQLIVNMELFLNKYGRWDDFVYLPLGSNSSNHYLKIISKQLIQDLENMNLRPISTVAKWIPSEKSKGYNHTGFNIELAKIMGINCRDLRKTFLTPLRKSTNSTRENNKSESEYKSDYSSDNMMNLLSGSQYDDICCVECV